MKSPDISVVFVTHNRKDLLQQAIKSVQQQRIAAQIIVMDDASTDGTSLMMQSAFPEVQYVRSEDNKGPSFMRNEGARLATCDIICFLDDDTVLQDKDTLEVVLHDFSKDHVGAVALPFINILQDEHVQTAAPDKLKDYFLHAFVAAAFAVKKQLFLQLGGFRTDYFYMGEEGDFCIRLLQAGYYVKAGTAAPAYHHQPPNRISFRADFYGRRNDILFAFYNVPRVYRIPYVTGTILKGLWFGIRVKRLGNMFKGTVNGLKTARQLESGSKAIDPLVFKKFRYLKKNEPLASDQLAL